MTPLETYILDDSESPSLGTVLASDWWILKARSKHGCLLISDWWIGFTSSGGSWLHPDILFHPLFHEILLSKFRCFNPYCIGQPVYEGNGLIGETFVTNI